MGQRYEKTVTRDTGDGGRGTEDGGRGMSRFVKGYDAVVLAVAHDEFKTMDLSEVDPGTVIYDIKAIWPKELVDARL